MNGKHILIVAAVMISVVSSFSVDSLKYQTFVPTSLPTPFIELEALSWDSTEEQQPEYNSNSLSLSLKLHHVDNLIMSSHHQGSKMTWESLFKKRLERDASRVLAITKSRSSTSGNFSSPVISGLPWGTGEYFTRIGVGSPSKDFYMVMDTWGHHILLQCLPCEICYKQIDPVFDPNTSSSFHRMPCMSMFCMDTSPGYCQNHKKCPYELSDKDGSFSKGEFVTETLTFGKSTEVPNVIIGCAHDSKGEFVAAAGSIGLSRHELSFLGQAGNKFGYMFSYCLPNRSSNKSSYLIFGDSPASGKAVYTPLVKNHFQYDLNMYYVGLEGISVGGLLVQGIDASTFSIDPMTGEGGVYVDSGFSVTQLPKSAYLALRDAFRNATKHLKPAAASKNSSFDTCYDLCGMKEVKLPTVDLHFARGVIVSLPQSNYMVPMDDKKMTYCFAFAGTTPNGGVSIIGNIQQQGIGMVFDLHNHRLGFVPNAC